MWAKYTYPLGMTHQNIVDDLVKIATGTTNKALLSTAGDATSQAATFIDATIPAGFEKHSTTYSSTTATNNASVFLRAPWHPSNVASVNSAAINDPLQYKYVEILLNSSNQLMLNMAETASQANPAVTTNKISNGTTTQPVTKTGTGTIYIYANGYTILLWGVTGGVFATCPIIVTERQRSSPWDTNAAGYPPLVSNNQSTGFPFNAFAPIRFKNRLGVDTNTSSTTACMATGAIPSLSVISTVRDSAGNDQHLLVPISVGFPAQGLLCGDISEYGGIYLTTTDYGRYEDEVVVGGKTYVVLTCGTTTGQGSGQRFVVQRS